MLNFKNNQKILTAVLLIFKYNVASTLSLPHCRTRTERQIAKYCPTRSLDRCKESVLIGRLLEVKGDSAKAFNFYILKYGTQLKVNRTVHAKRTNMGGPPRKHLLGKCLLNNF